MDKFQTFQNAVITGCPTFLLVTAPNCAPCEKIKPMFETVASVLGEYAEFHSIEMTELPAAFLRTRHIRSAPTVLMYRFGIEECRAAGKELDTFGLTASKFVDEYHEENVVESADYECEACQ